MLEEKMFRTVSMEDAKEFLELKRKKCIQASRSGCTLHFKPGNLNLSGRAFRFPYREHHRRTCGRTGIDSIVGNGRGSGICIHFLRNQITAV